MSRDPDKLIIPDLRSLFSVQDTQKPAEGTAAASGTDVDRRLYVPRPERWSVQIQKDGVREYCHEKTPGEDHFHLIVMGEVYLQRGDTKLCLNCALRLGVLTLDRQFWVRGESSVRDVTSSGPPTERPNAAEE